MPEEEKNAYAGYSRCVFNGLKPSNPMTDQPAPVVAGGGNAK